MSANPFQRALRDFQDYADDVQRASYQTVDEALRRFASTLAPTTPLGDVALLLPTVAFDEWYGAQLTGASQGRIGGGSLRWPDGNGDRLSVQCELIRRLASGQLNIIHWSHQFMRVGSRHDENIGEFNRQLFRPFVRDFLKFAHDSAFFEARLQEQTAASAHDQSPTDDLSLFISHSGADAATAKVLVTLFEKALKISARKIRCTSVDGYRLPAGVDTNDVLRTEVFGAKLFVALLTPTSLQSSYVLFELGARWGARRPFFPLLAAGATPTHLHAPLSGLNALSAAVPDQVRQLIEDSAAVLSVRLEPLASFSGEIDAVVAIARSSP